jgi:hypothetical protein
MLIKPSLIAAAALIVLALTSSGAAASPHAKSASACSYKASRLALQGNVSCGEARRTMGAWARGLASNRCREAYCGVGGGWECSFEVPRLGREARCKRRGASFDVYKISAHPKRRAASPLGESTSEFISPDKHTWCEFAPFGGVFCQESSSSEWGHSATIDRYGQVTLCTTEIEACDGVYYERPVLQYGQQIEMDGVRCASAAQGIECTSLATHIGFLINLAEAVRVG